MRPVCLTVEGLTAYRQPQTVDLSGLDLFVITGPTGSGKTSILDAMTFALYGDVCRVKSGELRDLITHNHDVAKVQLEFEVKGEGYRVVRRMKRRGQPDAMLERKGDDGEYVSLVEVSGVRAVNKHVESLLGLDFDAFTKAVLLPQGRFQEFLSGDANTRRAILTRLLEIERYLEVGARARARARDIGVSLEERKHRLDDDYAEATELRHKQLRDELKDATKRATSLAKAADEAGEIAQGAERAKERIALLEREVEPVRDLLSQLAELRESLPKILGGEEAARKLLSDAEDHLNNAESVLLKGRDELVHAVERLGGDEAKLTELLGHARTFAGESSRLQETAAGFASLEESLGKNKEAADAAERQLKEATAADSDIEQEVERATLAYDLALNLQKLATASVALTNADTDLKNAAERLTRAKTERTRCEDAIEHLRTEHRADAIRRELVAGEPCPVCEQAVGAVPELDRNLDTRVKKAKAAQTAATVAQDAAEKELSSAEARQLAADGRVAEIRALIPPDTKELDQTAAESHLASALDAVNLARESRAKAAEAKTSAETEARAAEKQLAELIERVAGAKRERDDLSSRIAEAQSSLKPLFGENIPDDVHADVESRLASLREAQKAVKSAEAKWTEAKGAVDRARAASTEQEQQAQLLGRRIEGIRGAGIAAAAALLRHAPELQFPPAAIEDGENPVHHVERIEGHCLSVTVAVAALQSSLGETITAAGAQVAEIAKPLDLHAAGTVGEAAARVIEGAKSSEKHVIDLTRDEVDLAVAVEKRKALEAGMEADSSRQLLYQRLGLELQADRFLAYVLGESMRTLAAQATAELGKITQGRYSIEPRESGFEVVDHENADERRSVATLSGGETFLASLALALALSSSVKDLAGNAAAARLESMFIDEGFGALDAETLDTAVEALEQLAGEHRMIGVISHVPTLAERIPEGIEVRKVGASSTVTRR